MAQTQLPKSWKVEERVYLNSRIFFKAGETIRILYLLHRRAHNTARLAGDGETLQKTINWDIKEDTCVIYFSAAVIRHHDQGSSKERVRLSTWYQSVKSAWWLNRGMAAATAERSLLKTISQRQRACWDWHKSVETLKPVPVTHLLQHGPTS